MVAPDRAERVGRERPGERPVAKVVKVVLLAWGSCSRPLSATTCGVDDVAPDFMMLLAVCAGFVAGPDKGAVVGFAAGLVSDLFLQSTPFGLSALAACLAGFVVGWAGTDSCGPACHGPRWWRRAARCWGWCCSW